MPRGDDSSEKPEKKKKDLRKNISSSNLKSGMNESWMEKKILREKSSNLYGLEFSKFPNFFFFFRNETSRFHKIKKK